MAIKKITIIYSSIYNRKEFIINLWNLNTATWIIMTMINLNCEIWLVLAYYVQTILPQQQQQQQKDNVIMVDHFVDTAQCKNKGK